jgi:hypothetical protein
MTPELASGKLKSMAVFLLRQRPGWKGDFTGDHYALAIVRMIKDEKVQAATAWLLAQGPNRGFDGVDATFFLLYLTARAFGEERSLWTPVDVDAQRTKMLEAAQLAYAEAAAAEFEGDEAKARGLYEEAAYIESLAQELGVNDPTVAPYGKDLSPNQALARGMALIVAAALKKEFGREFTRAVAAFVTAAADSPVTRDMVKRRFAYEPKWSRSSAHLETRTARTRAVR